MFDRNNIVLNTHKAISKDRIESSGGGIRGSVSCSSGLAGPRPFVAAKQQINSSSSKPVPAARQQQQVQQQQQQQQNMAPSAAPRTSKSDLNLSDKLRSQDLILPNSVSTCSYASLSIPRPFVSKEVEKWNNNGNENKVEKDAAKVVDDEEKAARGVKEISNEFVVKYESGRGMGPFSSSMSSTLSPKVMLSKRRDMMKKSGGGNKVKDGKSSGKRKKSQAPKPPARTSSVPYKAATSGAAASTTSAEATATIVTARPALVVEEEQTKKKPTTLKHPSSPPFSLCIVDLCPDSATEEAEKALQRRRERLEREVEEAKRRSLEEQEENGGRAVSPMALVPRERMARMRAADLAERAAGRNREFVEGILQQWRSEEKRIRVKRQESRYGFKVEGKEEQEGKEEEEMSRAIAEAAAGPKAEAETAKATSASEIATNDPAPSPAPPEATPDQTTAATSLSSKPPRELLEEPDVESAPSRRRRSYLTHSMSVEEHETWNRFLRDVGQLSIDIDDGEESYI